MEMKFNERLTNLRTTKGITQDQLANKMEVSRQAISKWERGNGLPDLYNVQKLANILDVSVDYLINGSSKEQEYQPHDEQQYADQHRQNDYYTNSSSPQGINFIKTLLYKAKHTTNSAEAQKIKNYLLIGGGLGVLAGLIMIGVGFFGFANGAFNSVNDFGSSNFPNDPTGLIGFEPVDPKPFNPIPYMALFLSGGLVSGISMYAVYGGLAITVAKIGANYLDTRKKCPQCQDEVDPDEDVCSSCGYKIKEHTENICRCGKINQANDVYCRSCGLELKKSHH